jgi:iron complex transport system ATP-binding protein
MFPLLSLESVNFSYGKDKIALNNINLLFEKGKFYSIIGRNGSGKSTLVNLIAGVTCNYSGNILYNQKNIKTFSQKFKAQHISFIPQHNLFNDLIIRVFDYLCLGRYPYKTFSEFGTNGLDKEIVDFVLEILSIKEFKNKYIHELSGGERQKVVLALALVQLDCRNNLSDKILIVDEPLTHLDVNYQYDIFNVLSKLNNEQGLTILTVIHDLNIALKYTDYTILLENGTVVSKGRTVDIITRDSLEKYFMIKSQIINFENEYHINFIPN